MRQALILEDSAPQDPLSWLISVRRSGLLARTLKVTSGQVQVLKIKDILKKAVKRHWLLPDPPPIQEWTDIVDDIYLMEKITFSLRLQKNTFVRRWTKWVRYVTPLHTED